MTTLSENLCSCCVVDAAVQDVARVLTKALSKFGEVVRGDGVGQEAALERLLPLLSFANRYLLLPYGSWTMLLSNCLGTAADEWLVVVSREANCRGVLASWGAGGRIWRFADQGNVTRAVQLIEDPPRWEFYAQGTPLPFERTDLYRQKRKQDRLPTAVVLEYLSALTGVAGSPDWGAPLDQPHVVLERSTADVKVPIETYLVDVDI